MEINRNNYASCRIICCTICPTFGSASYKQIIQFYANLKIIWLVKLVEYFIGDVGAEVMLKNHKSYYAYFCTCNDFSHHLYHHYIEKVD